MQIAGRKLIILIAVANLFVSTCTAQQTRSVAKKRTPTAPRIIPAGSYPLKMDIRGFKLTMPISEATDHLKAITKQNFTRGQGWNDDQRTNIRLPLPPIIDPNTGREWRYEYGTREQQDSIDFTYPTELRISDDDKSQVKISISYDYPVKDNKSGYVGDISYTINSGPRSEEVRQEVPAKLLAKYGPPQLVRSEFYDASKPLDSNAELLWCEHIVWVNTMLMPHYDCKEGEPVLRYNWPWLNLYLDLGTIEKRNQERWRKDQAKPEPTF